MLIALLVVAAAACGLLVAGWIWYPRHMAARGATARPVFHALADPLPAVSVILATREDTAAIAARVRNLLALEYPQSKLEIVVALDQSRAGAHADVAASLGGQAVVVAASAPGKSSALNAGVGVARHDLLFFVDTAQSFAPDVLQRLASVLQDTRWGAVTATLAPTSGDALMDRYWQRELGIRLGQTERHSVICVTGCAYLMRRSYWQAMPVSLICDDLWSTYSVVTRGGRVAIDSGAAVSDPRRFTREQEYARRLRTMTGMLQFMKWFPDVLSPRRNPMFLDFLLHKLVRPATPILLFVAAGGFLGAIATVSTRAAAVLAAVGLTSALLPWALATAGPGALRTKAQTVLFAQRLVLMPLRAWRQAALNDWDVWKPHR